MAFSNCPNCGALQEAGPTQRSTCPSCDPSLLGGANNKTNRIKENPKDEPLRMDEVIISGPSVGLIAAVAIIGAIVQNLLSLLEPTLPLALSATLAGVICGNLATLALVKQANLPPPVWFPWFFSGTVCGGLIGLCFSGLRWSIVGPELRDLPWPSIQGVLIGLIAAVSASVSFGCFSGRRAVWGWREWRNLGISSLAGLIPGILGYVTYGPAYFGLGLGCGACLVTFAVGGKYNVFSLFWSQAAGGGNSNEEDDY